MAGHPQSAATRAKISAALKKRGGVRKADIKKTAKLVKAPKAIKQTKVPLKADIHRAKGAVASDLGTVEATTRRDKAVSSNQSARASVARKNANTSKSNVAVRKHNATERARVTMQRQAIKDAKNFHAVTRKSIKKSAHKAVAPKAVGRAKAK